MKKKDIVLSGMILLAMVFSIGIGIAQPNSTPNVCTSDPTILAGDRRCYGVTPLIPLETPEPPNISEILVDDIAPYKGLIGPDNIFYGLKKTFEDLDELFTLNASDKLKKQIAHARQRIAEARTELERNNTEAANRALDGYLEKTKAINSTVSELTLNETGLLSNAGEMILYHREAFDKLLNSHPDNMRLRKAYKSSEELYKRFFGKIGQMAREEKTKIEARIFGNVSQVRVSIVFTINNSEEGARRELLKRTVNLSRDEISRLLELKEGEGGEEIKQGEGGQETSFGINFTVVRIYNNFFLNATSRDEIIEGIYQSLSESPYPIVPSSTPSMTESLEGEMGAAGLTVKPVREISQPFFSVKGRIISVNGNDIQVFEYASANSADNEAALVSQDGSSVGTTMITWVAAPHFYKKEKAIVLYVGDDAAVIKGLETVLGKQFAGR